MKPVAGSVNIPIERDDAWQGNACVQKLHGGGAVLASGKKTLTIPRIRIVPSSAMLAECGNGLIRTVADDKRNPSLGERRQNQRKHCHKEEKYPHGCPHTRPFATLSRKLRGGK